MTANTCGVKFLQQVKQTLVGPGFGEGASKYPNLTERHPPQAGDPHPRGQRNMPSHRFVAANRRWNWSSGGAAGVDVKVNRLKSWRVLMEAFAG